jgi:hypothetical protein
MPYASTTTRERIRSEVRARDGDAPCALMITDGCRAVGCVIVDHVAPQGKSGDSSVLCWLYDRGRQIT